jgi:lysozyme
MKTSARGVDFIKAFEGFRSKPYLCQASVWTIGYGHTVGVTQDSPIISEADAAALLQSDLKHYEASVLKLIRVPLWQCEFDALVSFAFNLGGGALQRSTLRQKLNRWDRHGAAVEFLKWTRANGAISRGLLRRRQAEMEMFLEG